MNIKGILLALVGAVVGLVAGLIISGLGALVGLPVDFVPVVWGLSALAGGYLAFVGAIPMKVLFSLASVIVALCTVALCAVAILAPTEESLALKNTPLKAIELRQMLEKCSCEPKIQAEVDSLLSRFGEESQSLHEVDSLLRRFGEKSETTAPVLDRFSKTLGDRTFLEIVPHDYLESDIPTNLGSGIPTHLRLRFQHFKGQYILFFRTGTDASLVMPPNGAYEHVTGNIYSKPGQLHMRKH